MINTVIKKFINNLLSFFNLQLNRITLSSNFTYYIVRVLINFKIDYVLDIGANEGQFAEQIRKYGFKKDILSYEPMKNAYKKLSKKSENSNNWKIYNNGFGNKEEQQTLNISKNSVSSSILNLHKKSLIYEPNSKYISKETINLITLDRVLTENRFKKKNIFVKIDTQGYEKNILIGASKVLKKIKGIMLEVSVVPIYKGEKNFIEMIKFMEKKGFYVWAIERGFSNKNTARVFQLDIIFINKNA